MIMSTEYIISRACLHTRFDDCLLPGAGWNWMYSVANGIDWSVWREVACGLCHVTAGIVFCSEMSWLCSLSVWMYSYSYGDNNELLLTCFSKGIVLSMGLYSCLLLRMYCAHADWGLYFIYLMCSWYLCLKLRLVCTTYAIWHVLRIRLYIPLLSISCVVLIYFCFMRFWIVLVVLNAIPMLVCLKRFVIFLIFGL